MAFEINIDCDRVLLQTVCLALTGFTIQKLKIRKQRTEEIGCIADGALYEPEEPSSL